ncbi:MAG: nitroreductase family deazaflavin-dependent oxidoreductase [Pseudomonadales bacterium]|nr:nitroreductase family deazaflavin-dependent oxidoreductase [Pseudomonadales bacterium]MCP5184703.1 nitroreductase family deazaflavin-dependent oxidoreductase [Pseudomonadales bacterium]
MKALKWIVILLVVYAGIVTLFESLLGYFQPANESTLSITTFDADGQSHTRVLARIELDGKLFVAANHWPRGWYNEARANPAVEATVDGRRGSYTAVPVTDSEHDTVNNARPLGLGFRLLTGFPPRYFLRLDPR